MTYSAFIFKDYSFSSETKQLTLTYGYDNEVEFNETYLFDFEFTSYDPAMLERALQTLFFVAGVSYYKAYVPAKIEIQKGSIDKATAEFLTGTYQNGLGEFFYLNKLDPRTNISFPVNTDEYPAVEKSPSSHKKLVGLGGGKDSLVTVELLSSVDEPFATWSVDHKSQLNPLVQKIGKPHFYVERVWDRQLLELNKQGAMNGHIPISAIFAGVGTVVAILSGYQDVVVSNEQSANEPTLMYEGMAINHQYSKSQAFEKDFQAHLQHTLGENVRYYSFLRSLSELRIAEIFGHIGLQKYKDVFSSCNRAFVHSSHEMFWCGECSKCAFVFLALTPFVERTELEQIWHGKNLLLDESLQPTYKKLLGLEGDKPLDCVGEIKESRAAMRLAQAVYPELSTLYEFELPDDYDYKHLWSNELPQDVQAIFSTSLSKLAGTTE